MLRTIVWTCALAAALAASRAWAVQEAPAAGDHWIGVATGEIPEVLAKHLKTPQGVYVGDVVPDSPAAKGGIEKHDVLVKFGDVELASTTDLIKAVQAVGEKQTAVEALRGGERLTLQVTPAKRPVAERVEREPRRVAPRVERFGGEGGALWRGFFMRPGAVEKLRGEFPLGWSITIQKEGEAPAKITVEKGDTKVETTSEALDKLPEEVRPYVARMLDKPTALLLDVPGPGGFEFDLDVPGRFGPRVRIEGEAGDAHREMMREMERVRKEMEELRKRFLEGIEGKLPPKAEEPKAEAPKADEPKADEPKEEAPKSEL